MVRSLALAPPDSVPASKVHVSVGAGDNGEHDHPMPETEENVVSDGRSHVTCTPVAKLGPALVTVYATANGVPDPAAVEPVVGAEMPTSAATVVVTEEVSALLDVSGSPSAPDDNALEEDRVPAAVSSSTVYETVSVAADADDANDPDSVQVSVGAGDAGVHDHPVPVEPERVAPEGRSHVICTPDAALGPALDTSNLKEGKEKGAKAVRQQHSHRQKHAMLTQNQRAWRSPQRWSLD